MTDELSPPISMELALYRTNMYRIGRMMSAEAMTHLWQTHEVYGATVCTAQLMGEICCVNILLESKGRPSIADPLPEILALGYDVQIEADTADRYGRFFIYLTYEGQTNLDDCKFPATLASLYTALMQALTVARAFPRSKR
jgi:hypothetical protein